MERMAERNFEEKRKTSVGNTAHQCTLECKLARQSIYSVTDTKYLGTYPRTAKDAHSGANLLHEAYFEHMLKN